MGAGSAQRKSVHASTLKTKSRTALAVRLFCTAATEAYWLEELCWSPKMPR